MTDRNWLLHRLEAYVAADSEDAMTRDRIVDFVSNTPDCFSRHHPPGHITASAWIIDPDSTSSLLVHHKKLNRWLQPGGHIEGDATVLDAARRELTEETGLTATDTLDDTIFDVDIHPIPSRGNEPGHLHYDVRFLFIADKALDLSVSEESHDLRWFLFAEIHNLGEGRSIDRMIEKAASR